MKRLSWYSKILFLLTITFVMLGGFMNRLATAQREDESRLESCNVDKWCSRTSAGQCSCSQRACNGCFIEEGDTGCGRCAIQP